MSNLRGRGGGGKSSQCYHQTPKFRVWKQRTSKKSSSILMTLMTHMQSRKVPTEKNPTGLPPSVRPEVQSEAKPSAFQDSDGDGPAKAARDGQKLQNETCPLPFPLVGIPSTESLKQGAWAGMSWFPFHLPSQVCYGPQVFHHFIQHIKYRGPRFTSHFTYQWILKLPQKSIKMP